MDLVCPAGDSLVLLGTTLACVSMKHDLVLLSPAWPFLALAWFCLTVIGFIRSSDRPCLALLDLTSLSFSASPSLLNICVPGIFSLCLYVLQAGHDQAARLNRACPAAFPVPKQFVEAKPGFGSDNGGRGKGGGGDSGIPPELRQIGREELDFGGKVRGVFR